MSTIRYDHLADFAIVELLRQHSEDILARWANHLKCLDFERALNSEYNLCFRHLMLIDSTPYCVTNWSKIRQPSLIAKLRWSIINVTRIYLEEEKYSIDTSIDCKVCNLNEDETLVHIILNCTQYDNYRETFMPKCLVCKTNNKQVDLVLNSVNVKDNFQILCIFRFSVSVLK